MAYTKTNWQNLPSTNTPVNATNLNKIENGIVPANTQLISSGSVNLNDYKTDGVYHFTGATLTNAPAGTNGWLRVMAGVGGATKQIWFRHGTVNVNDYQTFVRTYSSDTWSSWKKFQIEEDTGWITATLGSGVSAGNGLGGTKGIKYRKIGNHVFIRGSIATTWGGGAAVELTTALPTEYQPAYRTVRFVPLTGVTIARIFMETNGILKLEWVKNIADGSNVTTASSWVAIDIDYFTDLT